MTTFGNSPNRTLLGVLLLAGILSLANGAVAQEPATAGPESAVDARVATMTDKEARETLIATLHAQAKPEPDEMTGGGVGVALAMFRFRLQGFIEDLERHAATLAIGLQILPAEFATALGRVGGDTGLPLLTLELAGILVLGFAVHIAIMAATWDTRRRLVASGPADMIDRCATAALWLGFNLLPVAGFAAVSFTATALFVSESGPEQTFVITFVSGALVVLVLAALIRFLIAPYTESLRIVPIGDAAARFLYRWTLLLIGAGTLLWLFAGLVILSGMPVEAHLVTVLSTGGLMTLLVVAMAVAARRPVAIAIRGGAPGPLQAQIARSWLWLFILYMAAVYALWALSMLARGPSAIWPALASLSVVVALPLIDRAVAKWLTHGFRLAALAAEIARRRSEAGPDDEAGPESVTTREIEDIHARLETRRRYFRLAMQVTRLGLLGLAGMTLFQLWGFGFGGAAGAQMQAHVWDILLDVGITVFIAWLAWRAITALVDPHMPSAREETADEGGEVLPRTRLETLLPLLRNTIFVVLVVFTAMIVLSSMGLDIGPLLAGAGVVGLAIGFGAQTLVRDIVSGIFFLVDDAFRVGEYIEFGKIRGEVEAITLRSLKLRHHRGAVHTVPFGELQTVTNYNRDWVIYKMEFRMPMDTDIAKVKKVVKKIGKEMMADPEFADKLLQPLKSQGIKRVEENAIILRMKFMCKPREQFILRREAYNRIKEAFAAEDIRFAPRQIQVHSRAPGNKAEPDEVTAGAATAIDGAQTG